LCPSPRQGRGRGGERRGGLGGFLRRILPRERGRKGGEAPLFMGLLRKHLCILGLGERGAGLTFPPGRGGRFPTALLKLIEGKEGGKEDERNLLEAAKEGGRHRFGRTDYRFVQRTWREGGLSLLKQIGTPHGADIRLKKSSCYGGEKHFKT